MKFLSLVSHKPAESGPNQIFRKTQSYEKYKHLNLRASKYQISGLKGSGLPRGLMAVGRLVSSGMASLL